MKLVTNNPKFKDEIFKNIEIEYADIAYDEVLLKVRDYVHGNWEIITHPLYGSVKPNETVYRSVVIDKKDKLDLTSINLISDAIATFNKFKGNKVTPKWTETVKDDFSVIDFDLITNAIQRIIK